MERLSAESVLEIASEVTTGLVFDNDSKMWFDTTRDMYYDMASEVYYDYKDQSYYRKDYRKW